MKFSVTFLATLFVVVNSCAQAFAAGAMPAPPPYIDEGGQAAFADFLQADRHAAFALSPTGAWGYASVLPSVQAAADRAMELCQRASRRSACFLYAADGRVLENGRLPKARAAQPVHAAAFTVPPGYPHLGPGRAKGAIVWSHGKLGGGADSRTSPVQPWVKRFVEAGYDLYRFDREPERDDVAWATRQMVAGAQALRQQGYRTVISAGQSRGGWHGLEALADGAPLFDASIAIAPAMHGIVAGQPWAEEAMEDFRRVVGALDAPRAGRVAIVMFEGDEYDPGTSRRADLAAEGLAAAGVPHLVLVPSDFTGHGGGTSRAFADRYGDCLLRFATGKEPACR
jgi:hypothetical protein